MCHPQPWSLPHPAAGRVGRASRVSTPEGVLAKDSWGSGTTSWRGQHAFPSHQHRRPGARAAGQGEPWPAGRQGSSSPPQTAQAGFPAKGLNLRMSAGAAEAAQAGQTLPGRAGRQQQPGLSCDLVTKSLLRFTPHSLVPAADLRQETAVRSLLGLRRQLLLGIFTVLSAIPGT